MKTAITIFALFVSAAAYGQKAEVIRVQELTESIPGIGFKSFVRVWVNTVQHEKRVIVLPAISNVKEGEIITLLSTEPREVRVKNKVYFDYSTSL